MLLNQRFASESIDVTPFCRGLGAGSRIRSAHVERVE